MKTAKTSNYFHDKPLFGLDIGHGSLKAMQIEMPADGDTSAKSKPKVLGYGFTTFDKQALKDGVIIKPEIIAEAAYKLFDGGLQGEINTRRVSIAIPTYRTFTRSLQLPNLEAEELQEAVELEAEQYISLPLEELYLDYEIVRQTESETELFVVAVPRTIVDSYVDLASILGLEAILIEPTLSSSGRFFSVQDNGDDPAFIIDFGSMSSDISIYDKHTLVTGTAQGGGASFTDAIASQLGVSQQEAGQIKTRYGLGAGKHQAEIQQALDPTLNQILKEIRRMLRYYEERYSDQRPVSQIITLGGGANMPGLSDYLTNSLRMAVRHADPWQYLDYDHLELPDDADRPMYATVTGLSLVKSKEVFAHD
jgi:type IV pilus assembly protein PilM